MKDGFKRGAELENYIDSLTRHTGSETENTVGEQLRSILGMGES